MNIHYFDKGILAYHLPYTVLCFRVNNWHQLNSNWTHNLDSLNQRSWYLCFFHNRCYILNLVNISSTVFEDKLKMFVNKWWMTSTSNIRLSSYCWNTVLFLNLHTSVTWFGYFLSLQYFRCKRSADKSYIK